MASIKDVAAYAGVAVSTVSKVLNNYPGVSETTKEKVNQAVKELKFVPNAVAAALSSKQSGRAALIMKIPEGTGAAYEVQMDYLSGAMKEAEEQGLDVITIFYNMIEHRSTEDVIAYLDAQSITGLIIFGMDRNDTLLDEIVSTGRYKCVLVNRSYFDENTSSVWHEQAKAQYDIAKRTMEGCDCHRILYLAGKASEYVTEQRIMGIRSLAEENGIELRVLEGEDSEKKARELTFEYGLETDMIACASDLMAIGSMRALIEMDVFHPVCGFGGLSLMAYAGKQMNTVKLDFEALAARAVTELKSLFAGESGKHITLDYELARVEYLDSIR